ncbi:MAG: hypothetical protein ABI912_01790 [Actinomycetota bacterium]
MPDAAVTVLGSGTAGLATALVLARDGNRVRLIERDTFEPGGPADAVHWPRKGVPQFLLPHSFIPRGRAELRRHLPDVYAALLAAGAAEVDVRPKLPGTLTDADDDLRFLAVRRPLVDWALMQAVIADARIDVRTGSTVDGLRAADGRISAVVVDGAMLPVDLVVDALGRRSRTARWLVEAGVASADSESNDCHVTYYSRYYRLKAGCELPDGPWLRGPRGDLGYLGFAAFHGDNGTVAALLEVPAGVPEWRVLNDPAAFERAVAAIPALRQWADAERVDPITGVAAMAGLRNTIRSYDGYRVTGLVPVGDAYSHTDPVLAHGLSFALIHASALAACLREHRDRDDALASYAAATAPALRQRFEFATRLDEQRRRLWNGETVDFTRPDGGAYELFTFVAGGAAALVDPDVFRVVVRRLGLLDGTDVLDSDVELQQRIAGIFAGMLATPRPRPGPSRDEMLALAGRPLG